MAAARSFFLPTPIAVPATHWDGELAADVFAPCGTPVLAPFDGAAQPMTFSLGGFTNRVIADDGTTFYVAHLSDGGRTAGQVTAGQVIGYVSDSGNAAGKGCHAHIAVGQINSRGGGTIRPVDFFSGAPVATDTPAAPGDQSAPIAPTAALGIGLGALVLAGIVLWSVADEF